MIVRRILCGAMVAAGLFVTNAEAEELGLAHFLPPTHVMHQAVLAPFAADLERASQGRLTVAVFPAGQLGPAPQLYQLAVDGVADIALGVQGFTPDRFPRTMVAELPGIAETPEQVTEMIWDAFDGLLAEEYQGTRVLGIWASDRAVIMTRDRPVRTLEDLRGLKIRAPSIRQARLLEALGAVPLSIPLGEVHLALQRGVVDGVMTGPCTIPALRLNEVARYYTVDAPLAVTTFFTVMNDGRWNALSQADRELVASMTGRAWSVKASSAFAACATEGLAMARSTAGNEIFHLGEAERPRWTKALGAVISQTVAELDAAGVPVKPLLAKMVVGR